MANQKNLRKTWQILFSPIHKSNKKSNDLSNLLINGVNTDYPTLMACHFNKYFTSIANLTVQNINPSNMCPTSNISQNPNTFSFLDTALTKKEIIEATKLLSDKKNSWLHWYLHQLYKTNNFFPYQPCLSHTQSLFSHRCCSSPIQNSKSNPYI